MNIAQWIILACWIVLIGTWIVTSFTVKRDMNRSAWWRFWWVRIVVIGIIVAILSNTHQLSDHFLFKGSSTSNALLVGVAIVLCVFGTLVAIWARIHLGRNWSPAPNVKEGHELITSGPYKRIRHPIYTGILMAMLGSALMTPSWFPVFIIFSIIFTWRVATEEGLMTKQFPLDYPEYKKHTWALIPWVW